MGERRGTRGLELWCKRMTEGYPGVKVENMTTSWRDGLAFCAIIHHFRPDLIDFSKLDKKDIYHNNNLAFRIAEDHLGIPALLEPEDMVEYAVPDRLSILTYLSQFYQVFAVNSNSSNKVPTKRPPPADLQRHMVTASGSAPPKKAAYGALGARRDPCAKCGLPVFIAERLNFGKTLYHRTCFRCVKCETQLSVDNNFECENGELRCKTCPDKVKPMSETAIMNRSLSDEEKSASLKLSDPYSASFENALEDSRDGSLKRDTTLDRMMGSSFRRAREEFLTTQMADCDSELEEKPPDLPVTPKPELERRVDDHSESKDDFVIDDALPSLSDNSSVFSDQQAPKLEQFESQDPVTKDISIKPSIRSRMKVFEAGGEKSAETDVKEYHLESEKCDLNVACPSNETADSDASSHCSESSDSVSMNIEPDSSQVQSSIISEPLVLSDSKEVIVLSSDNQTDPSFSKNDPDDNSIITISDSSEDNLPDSLPNEKSSIVEDGEEPVATVQYPADLNPFGDDEEKEDDGHSPRNNRGVEVSTSESLNPFGDTDDEEDENSKSLNPFGSDDGDEDEELPPQPRLRKLKAPKISLTPYWVEDESAMACESHEENQSSDLPRPRLRRITVPRISLTPLGHEDSSSCQPALSSLSESRSEKTSLHGSGRKKKPAPKPPIPQFNDSPYSSLSSTPSAKLSHQSKEPPKSRKTKRAPLPPSSTPIGQSQFSRFPTISPVGKTGTALRSELENEGNMKAAKDEINRNKQSSSGSSPSGPIKKLTLKEIELELELVEVQMRGLEKNGVKLEKLIREKSEVPGSDPDETLSPEVEDMILELFELVNEKCELFRKQTELNYLRRQNRLEREQAEIEGQLRSLMLQPDAHKTDSDKSKEEELLNRMLEIVERRNEIVDRLEYDRRREAEEDKCIRNHMCLYSMRREGEHSASKKSVKKDKQKQDKERKNKKSKGDSSKDKKKKKMLSLF